MRRLKSIALALCVALSTATVTSGCFGSFAATDRLHEWNSEASDSRFVNWFVFLGLNVIPVYPVAILLDLVLFNTIEFWFGDHPSDVDRQADGSIEVERNGRTFAMRAESKRDLLILEDGQPLARARALPGERIELTHLQTGDTTVVAADRLRLLNAMEAMPRAERDEQ